MKSWPVLCSNLLHKMGQAFLDIRYVYSPPRKLNEYAAWRWDAAGSPRPRHPPAGPATPSPPAWSRSSPPPPTPPSSASGTLSPAGLQNRKTCPTKLRVSIRGCQLLVFKNTIFKERNCRNNFLFKTILYITVKKYCKIPFYLATPSDRGKTGNYGWILLPSS